MNGPEPAVGDALFEEAAAHLRQGRIAKAGALFGRAGDAGRLDAAVIHANLVTRGGDWQGGLALTRRLAPRNARSRRELDIVDAMDLTPAGDPVTPPRGEPISEGPSLTWFPGFLTAAECAYLAAAARPMLAPSVVIDQRTGRQVRDPVRTSDGVGFTPPLENPAIHAFNRRIAAASGTGVSQGEPLQVLRYRPGERYRPHLDAIPGFANQRILTMLIWLTADYGDGETWFPRVGQRFKGGVGDALLFRNVTADGARDQATLHAGLPVASGEKLIASRWIRQRAFELPAA